MTQFYVQVAGTDEIEAQTWEDYTTEHGPWITHKFETAAADVAKLRIKGEARALRIVEQRKVTVVETHVHEVYAAQSPEAMEILTSLAGGPNAASEYHDGEDDIDAADAANGFDKKTQSYK